MSTDNKTLHDTVNNDVYPFDDEVCVEEISQVFLEILKNGLLKSIPDVDSEAEHEEVDNKEDEGEEGDKETENQPEDEEEQPELSLREVVAMITTFFDYVCNDIISRSKTEEMIQRLNSVLPQDTIHDIRVSLRLVIDNDDDCVKALHYLSKKYGKKVEDFDGACERLVEYVETDDASFPFLDFGRMVAQISHEQTADNDVILIGDCNDYMLSLIS